MTLLKAAIEGWDEVAMTILSGEMLTVIQFREAFDDFE